MFTGATVAIGIGASGRILEPGPVKRIRPAVPGGTVAAPVALLSLGAAAPNADCGAFEAP